jgi:hypothetical protein
VCGEHLNHGAELDGGLDRRSLMAAGAGMATYAAAATVAPAAAAAATSGKPGKTRTETMRFEGHFDQGGPDWHYLPFTVVKSVTEIRVSYDYVATSTGAGVTANVIDIGLFDGSGRGLGKANGFRGWSGGARREFRVSRHYATPGYLAGPLKPGTWHVALGPFTVVAPGVDWQVTVTLVHGRPRKRFRPNPAPRRVKGSGPGWYRGDLHTHTLHSDGRRSPKLMAKHARAADLDFFVSTEHNTNSAHGSWGRWAGDDLLIINGEEVTTRGGHWIAAGLPAGAWIDWRYRPEDGQLRRFTDRTRALGGLAIACHPWVPIPSTQWDFGYDYDGIDAIELWNGPWTLDDNHCVEHWHSLLQAGQFVSGVGSSDTHGLNQPIGTAQTVVRAPTLSVAAIMAGVKGGHSWLAENSEVDLTFTATAGGATGSCGDRLGAGPEDVAEVTLTVAGTPNCVAQIIGPSDTLAATIIDGSGAATLTATVPVGLAAFVRAEVRRLDGAPVVNPLEGVPGLAMVAMTNPIFLD